MFEIIVWLDVCFCLDPDFFVLNFMDQKNLACVFQLSLFIYSLIFKVSPSSNKFHYCLINK